MKRTRIAILGGGPAGLGAAWQLARHRKAKAIVLEQRDHVGGNAGSFEIDGLPVDYGSHRLHPACKPQILDDLRALLGKDLIDRQRHGRIRLGGRWLHFPLKPIDLMFHMPLSFGAGVLQDSLRKVVLRPRNGVADTFASVLERGLGRTICHEFYFPYAVKIWGLPPQELSPIQAHRRVSAGSLGKMVRKVIGLVPGFKTPGSGRFYYPSQGYGQICQAIATEARKIGVEIQLCSTVQKIRWANPHRIEIKQNGVVTELEADHIWSTIPSNILVRLFDPPAPAQVLAAGQRLDFRAMILIYLVLAEPQFSPFDAHYFPEADIKLTRLSEPKNYSGRTAPADRTVLCGELPCTVNDVLWRSTDRELAEIVKASLAHCELPVKAQVLKVTTRRLPFAYPIYRQGYEEHFTPINEWIAGLERVLTFGRQGLFAHDNTHHALAMAYAAADCLTEAGTFDAGRWRDYLAEFAKHVVED